MKLLRLMVSIFWVSFLLGMPVHADEYERPQAEEPTTAVVRPAPVRKAVHIKKPSRKVAANKKYLRVQGEDVELAPAPLMINKP